MPLRLLLTNSRRWYFRMPLGIFICSSSFREERHSTPDFSVGCIQFDVILYLKMPSCDLLFQRSHLWNKLFWIWRSQRIRKKRTSIRWSSSFSASLFLPFFKFSFPHCLTLPAFFKSWLRVRRLQTPFPTPPTWRSSPWPYLRSCRTKAWLLSWDGKMVWLIMHVTLIKYDIFDIFQAFADGNYHFLLPDIEQQIKWRKK